VPDVRYGEELCAWIRVRGDAELTADDVRAYCTGKIAHYKIPRYVRLTTEFPMTVTGKIQKYKMRETSISELGLEAASETRTA
jgi:fatty-acyl-CoA synthase